MGRPILRQILDRIRRAQQVNSMRNEERVTIILIVSLLSSLVFMGGFMAGHASKPAEVQVKKVVKPYPVFVGREKPSDEEHEKRMDELKSGS